MMDYNLFILRVDLVLSPSPRQITRAHKCHKISKNNPADYYFDIRWPLKSRNLVQPCLVIVCPTKKGNKQRPKFLVHIQVATIKCSNGL